MDNLEFQECCNDTITKAALTEEESNELLDNSLPKREGQDLLSDKDIDAIAKSIVDNI